MKLRPEQVEGARGMLQMSREDLARAAGVNAETIFLFERGKTVPREDTLWRIQAALEDRGIIFTNGDTPGIKLDTRKAAGRHP